MKKRSRLDMERGIIRSLQPRDKAAFGELEMNTRSIGQNYIDNFFRLDKKPNYLSIWSDLL